jgi:two-component system response regulator AtoC
MLVKVPPQNDDESVVGSQESKNYLAPCFSPLMRDLESVIADIAKTDIPVLLIGETGTGKEVTARMIHQLSRRREGPFIRLRCSSLKPEDFNHLLPKSDQERAISNLSTVFLDEISDMNPACQARLLESFSGCDGGPERFQWGAGLISTTCQSLEEAMEAGQFRQELYYRLSGICLRLPPLRQRKEDILPLAGFFLDKYSALFTRQRPQLSPWAIRLLQEYTWPGNIRQLENTMRRVVALGDEKMALRDLGELTREAPSYKLNREFHSLKEAAREASRHAERELILKVLSRTRWNRKRAAEELRISYKALLYKLKQIGLEEEPSS